MKKNICIVASGGDSPGMNACVESIFLHATELGYNVYGVYNGYSGLIDQSPVLLTRETATDISHMSGCVLGCGRSDKFKLPEGTKAAIDTLKKLDIHAVIVIGGNGSTRGVARFNKNGFTNCIVIPGTIDNDVYFTESSLGFSSATEECIRHIDNLKATMQTKGRDHIVQLMGWHATDIADKVGAAAFADILDTNNHRYSAEEIAKKFRDLRASGSTSNLMIMQERVNHERLKSDPVQETIDAALFLGEIHKAAGDKEIRMTTLGHLQRGAIPSCRDRWLAVNYGRIAVDCAEKGTFSVGVGYKKGEFTVTPLKREEGIN